MDKSDVMYQLRHSLEMHTIKRDLLLYICCLGIPWLIMALNKTSSGPAVLLGLILLAILVFYVWRILSIFRDSAGYILTECELTQPHCNPYLGQMYFTVRIEMPNGRIDTVDTHAIFATHGIFEPIMEDYVNKSAWIAYNPSTGMVVVIG